MKLIRTAFRPDGIFGRLYNDHGVPLCYTLEHSFAQLDGSWLPKVAVGTYKCVRGQHQLASMTKPFTTFEVTGVPPFDGNAVTGILFHMGNFDKDSEGCILVGRNILKQADGSQIVSNSVHTFEDVMNAWSQLNEFQLVITVEIPTAAV